MTKQLSPFKRITKRAVRDFYRKLEKARCPYPLPPRSESRNRPFISFSRIIS